MANSSTLGDRLIFAFGTDDKEKIAKILGFASKQSVYKVISGERELDFDRLIIFRNYTKRSIDWLLTGRGPEFVTETANESVSIDDELYAKLWAVAKEQTKEVFDTIDLGSSDTIVGRTLDLLVEYLISVGLAEFGVIDSPFETVNPAHRKSISRMTLKRMSIEERLRGIVREEARRTDSFGGEVGPMRTEFVHADPPFWKKVGGGDEEIEEEERPRKRKTG